MMKDGAMVLGLRTLGALGALAATMQCGTAFAADAVNFQLDWTPGGI